MKCNHCGFENQADAKFCSSCGAKIETGCPNCGAKVEKADKFCKQCGQALAPSPKSKRATHATPVAPSSEVPQSHPANQPGKPGKKMPLWLIILLALGLLACLLIAIFGEFSFWAGAPNPTPTSETAATIKPLIVATPTPHDTATPTATVLPVYDTARVEVRCPEGYLQFVFEHQPVSVMSGEYAKTEEQVRDFMTKSLLNVSFDGEEIAPLMVFYEPFFDEALDAYRVEYGFDSDPLPVGTHLIETRLRFKEKYYDGIETYGPGTNLEEANHQCPLFVGAPDPSWQVIAQSDFSTDRDILPDKPVQGKIANLTTKEGQNGVYRVEIDTFDAGMQDSLVGQSIPLDGLFGSRDFLLSFDAEILQLPQEGTFGLMFRRDQETNNSYHMDIDPKKQEIRLWASIQGGQDAVTIWEGTTTALRSTGANQFVFLARENTFVLWVNGAFVMFAEDSTFLNTGEVYLDMTTRGVGLSVYAFDNLLIRRPAN